VYVMGERGVNQETATEADIQQMKLLLAEGVAAGAVGFSSSRTLLHLSSTGAHVPTYRAATSELKQLGTSLSGEQGHVMQFISDWEDAGEEFEILRETCRSTGARGTFTLAPIDAPSRGMNRDPQLWKQQLKMIEQAQAEGLDIRGQVISRPIGVLMGHPATMSPFRYRPTYQALMELSDAERLEKLRDPGIKARILSEDNENPHVFVKLLSKRFDIMFPLAEPIDYLPAKSDSVAAQASRAGREPDDWLYDYFLGNEGANLIYIPATSSSEEVISELLAHSHTVAALGDGGAHVGSICDTSANVFLLTKWVREKKRFDLAQGIHMITQQPAQLYSFNDRGLLAEGMKADINIIDFDKLALRTPHIVHDLPAGGKRFLQNADGIEMTLVSGEPIYSGGEATGALPGKLVRGMRAGPD
jgi:N-acyl-D-amino-acid deacylase